jgi:hypothetical protein
MAKSSIDIGVAGAAFRRNDLRTARRVAAAASGTAAYAVNLSQSVTFRLLQTSKAAASGINR